MENKIDSELRNALKIENIFGIRRDEYEPPILEMSQEEIRKAKAEGTFVPALIERIDPETGYATYHLPAKN